MLLSSIQPGICSITHAAEARSPAACLLAENGRVEDGATMTDQKRPGNVPGPSEPEAQPSAVPDFFTTSPEVARAIDAVQHEMRLERRLESFRVLFELHEASLTLKQA